MTVKEFKEKLEKLPPGLGSVVSVEVKGTRYPVTDVYEEKISTEDRNEVVLYLEAGAGEQLTLGDVTHFLLDLVDPEATVMTGTEDDMEGLVGIRMVERYGMYGSDKSVLLAGYTPYLKKEGGYYD